MSSKTGSKASVTYKRRDLIGTIILRRPDKRNALDHGACLMKSSPICLAQPKRGYYGHIVCY
jgi:enoyl-CoA hydratase/carnithine racemase